MVTMPRYAYPIKRSRRVDDALAELEAACQDEDARGVERGHSQRVQADTRALLAAIDEELVEHEQQ